MQLEKHITILNFIETLKLSVNFDQVQIVDYWDADLCAIGFVRENRMVYITNYLYLDNIILHYDYDLEILDPIQIDKLHVIKEGRKVTEEELINVIKLFLNVGK
ncbi:hypothetical protein LX64_04396 [Chitinophaga skermanii]|uniref:Uncharacterized protein n=1 Tax=Chitinophaga skermanii TaxID=331697 RepID=A0A327Q7J5_9BACT|nr:hypothetical protein LX64_04396 [Chitinophaga skermanii]